MGQYAARPPARRAYAPGGGAIEGNGADDALLVDQGFSSQPETLCNRLSQVLKTISHKTGEPYSRLATVKIVRLRLQF